MDKDFYALLTMIGTECVCFKNVIIRLSLFFHERPSDGNAWMITVIR